MRDHIIQHLKKIEEEKGIHILFACETGSRAWGFPSPDSDYDIRMIYVHEKDWYLSLSEGKDTIERMLEDNELDITGWDLRKALRLLGKSNAPMLERIQSPILYMHNPDFKAEINTLANSSYSRIATLHHYLSMAKKCVEDIDEKPSYKLKRFFYALRTSSVCRWILEKEEVPPIQFQQVMAGLEVTDERKEKINHLIEFKGQQAESYLHKGEKDLIDWIKESINLAEKNASSMPPSRGNKKDLDVFFKKWIK